MTEFSTTSALRHPRIGRSGAILAMFGLQAFAAGGLFTRIPDIQSGLELSEAKLGIALTVASAGALAIVPVAGRLIGRIGARIPLLYGISGMAVMSVLISLAPGYWPLILLLLAHWIAFSATNVAINIEAGRVELATGRRIMNRCHGLWALGMLAASLVGVGARAIPLTPALHFSLVAGPIILAVWGVSLAMDRTPPPPRLARRRYALPDRAALILTLFGLSAGVAQVGIQSWSVIFMRDTFAAPDWIDSLTLPAFLLAMTAGRLFADGWTARFGPARVAATTTLVALVGGVMVVFATALGPAILGFALIGIGGAVLYPLMISAAAEVPGRQPEETVASVILLYGLALLATPAAMGLIAEGFGLRVAFAAILPTMLITLALVRSISPRA